MGIFGGQAGVPRPIVGPLPRPLPHQEVNPSGGMSYFGIRMALAAVTGNVPALAYFQVRTILAIGQDIRGMNESIRAMEASGRETKERVARERAFINETRRRLGMPELTFGRGGPTNTLPPGGTVNFPVPPHPARRQAATNTLPPGGTENFPVPPHPAPRPTAAQIQELLRQRAIAIGQGVTDEPAGAHGVTRRRRAGSVNPGVTPNPLPEAIIPPAGNLDLPVADIGLRNRPARRIPTAAPDPLIMIKVSGGPGRPA